jgi:hypothetical protein
MSDSSLWLSAKEQCVGPRNDERVHHCSTSGHALADQYSTRSTLQSFLEFLDRHYHHDGVNSAYKDIIQICLIRMLANCQSEATIVNEETWNNNTDLESILGESLSPLN